MGKHRRNTSLLHIVVRKVHKAKYIIATASVSMAVAAPTIVGTVPASAATPQSIISASHAVQRQCAEKILAGQGPGAWTAWRGSLDNMTGESGNNDKAVNSSSGAAGYYQIMPQTWDSFGCGSGVALGGATGALNSGGAPLVMPQRWVGDPPVDSTLTLQHNLNVLSGRGLSEDGKYGPATALAVADFARFFHAPLSAVPEMTTFFVTL